VVLLSGGVRRGACQSQVGSGCTPIRRTGSSIGLFNRRRSFRCDRVEVAGSILFRVEGHEFFLDCVSPFDFIDLVEIQSKVFECIRAIAPDRDEYADWMRSGGSLRSRGSAVSRYQLSVISHPFTLSRRSLEESCDTQDNDITRAAAGT
jgi:hypothetical protein